MRIKLLLCIFNLVSIFNLVENKLILNQVVILNRHSLRSPLSSNLKDVSSKPWPKWNVMPGILTDKGVKLAGHMGSYFAAWLHKEEILPTSCPSDDDLQVFSNSVERTLTSAQSFIDSGFPDCGIKIQHTGLNNPNPLFDSIIHNTSAIFKKYALEEIDEALNILHLKNTYELLSNILGYKQSRSCEIDTICDLSKDKNYINIVPGRRPQLSGPLKIGNEIVDAFLMQNYEGFSNQDVAWGELTNLTLWHTVIELNRAYFNVTYKTRLVARDISKPLIKHISEIFQCNEPKVTLIFGHDVNIYTVYESLLVKQYTLENQLELIPIASAVVFQKWKDDETDKSYFKLNLFYQSTEQIRDCSTLNLESPPHIKTLELKNCIVDENGFCPWDDFISLLI